MKVAIFVQGAIQLFLAFAIRPARSWGWILFRGILGVILGIFITALYVDLRRMRSQVAFADLKN